MLFAFGHGMRCWDLLMPRMCMRGLIQDAVYICEDGRKMTDEALVNYGVEVALKGECDSRMERGDIQQGVCSGQHVLSGHAAFTCPAGVVWPCHLLSLSINGNIYYKKCPIINNMTLVCQGHVTL